SPCFWLGSCIEGSGFFDGVNSQVDHHPCIRPVYCLDVTHGDEYFFAADRMVGVDDEMGDLPGLVIHQEVVYAADFVPEGVDVVGADFVATPEVRVCCRRGLPVDAV